MAKQKPLKQKREAETQTGEAETRVVTTCLELFVLQTVHSGVTESESSKTH